MSVRPSVCPSVCHTLEFIRTECYQNKHHDFFIDGLPEDFSCRILDITFIPNFERVTPSTGVK